MLRLNLLQLVFMLPLQRRKLCLRFLGLLFRGPAFLLRRPQSLLKGILLVDRLVLRFFQLAL